MGKPGKEPGKGGPEIRQGQKFASSQEGGVLVSKKKNKEKGLRLLSERPRDSRPVLPSRIPLSGRETDKISSLLETSN